MEESPPRVPRKEGSHKSSKMGATRRNNHRCDSLDDAGDSSIKCSGKHCRSCTGGLIADCVALCCCPCAVVTFLGLAFVKAPWMMGKRCLGFGKKKRKCGKSHVAEIDGIPGMGRADVGNSEIVTSGFQDEEQNDTLSEEEGVWLELYELGHLSFGRVSFSGGIQSQGKGN
ncbi:uncharacterized protein LOC132267592 [Cornus florida]|uniref:uncharacterized protein LOC132267592 n=1 Tax=Cornus florida TaxID=4283 RepID=UPI0028982FCF|nr:uncharacterized protein LOC132267592 [Cornus florida]